MIHINVLGRTTIDTLNQRRWRERNPDKSKAIGARYYKAHPDKFKAWHKEHPEVKYESKYGNGAYEYRQHQIEAQGNRCAVCHKSFTSSRDTHLDHNHETEQWRGSLCNKCNRMLGFATDSTEVLRSAIAYLDKWRK